MTALLYFDSVKRIVVTNFRPIHFLETFVQSDRFILKMIFVFLYCLLATDLFYFENERENVKDSLKQ